MEYINTSALFNICYSVVVVSVCLLLGKLCYFAFEGLPNSLYGMILLNIFLQLRLVSQKRISETFSWAIRHMGVCFVPAGVGIINHFDLIQAHGLSIVAIIFVTTFALITLVGLLIERYQGEAQ
jgi:holin-like protein